MIRLIGVDLPNKKRIAYALTSIHGIGIQSAKILVESANIDDTIKTEDLSIEQTVALKQVLDVSRASHADKHGAAGGAPADCKLVLQWLAGGQLHLRGPPREVILGRRKLDRRLLVPRL